MLDYNVKRAVMALSGFPVKEGTNISRSSVHRVGKMFGEIQLGLHKAHYIFRNEKRHGYVRKLITEA